MDVETLNSVVTQLNSVVDELLNDEEPTIDDMTAWGQRLPEISYALVYATRTLRDRVLELGNRFELSDDRDRPPEENIIETADALRAFITLMERADPAARDFGASIAHLHAERALEPGEPPSLEVRTSTAADMARRLTPTTHVDREPENLMNDTVLGSRIRP